MHPAFKGLDQERNKQTCQLDRYHFNDKRKSLMLNTNSTMNYCKLDNGIKPSTSSSVQWSSSLERLFSALMGYSSFTSSPCQWRNGYSNHNRGWSSKSRFRTLSYARFLRFPQRNWPFPVSPAVNCPDFAATVIAYAG